jgi:hypothetical protein
LRKTAGIVALKTLTPQLPTIFGASSAMLVAFIGLMSGTSPGTCFIKATAAFLVFAGFGLILRYALVEAQSSAQHDNPATQGNLDLIVPGTSVGELLDGDDVHAEEAA